MQVEIVVKTEKEEPCFEELERTKEKAFELAREVKGMVVYGMGFTRGTLVIVQKDY
jgi:hypothetical protein